MTEPLTVTEIDAATKAELQPPCETGHGRIPCTAPAEWFVTSYCPACGRKPPKLLCAGHQRYWLAGRDVECLVCKDIHPAHVLSAVRL